MLRVPAQGNNIPLHHRAMYFRSPYLNFEGKEEIVGDLLLIKLFSFAQ